MTPQQHPGDVSHLHRLELADMIEELTTEHRHTERLTHRQGGHTRTAVHRTRVPALLTQLWSTELTTSAEEGMRPGFGSKPPARLDALDTAVRIDLQASAWLRDLGEHDPLDTAACIRRLGALHASADKVTQRELEKSIRSWWTQARIVTGWDSPAWNPDNTCPQCGERGTLKIRLAEHLGMCTNDACRVTWNDSTIGLLADHIRAESSVERRPESPVGPCWCPWPEPRVPDLSVLCPRCGNSRCWHAVSARFVASLTGGDTPGVAEGA